MKVSSFQVICLIVVLSLLTAQTYGSHRHREPTKTTRAHHTSSLKHHTAKILAPAPATMKKKSGCRTYPVVCRLRGSSGPDCCRNACVNVLADARNCGQCGNKCGKMETCCGGECVNVLFSMEHCGRCDNRCRKGSDCSYGMCDYA